MQATLTGLKYEIRFEEPQYESNQLKVRIYEINRQTFIIKPLPVLSINTNVDSFGEALRNHYGESPFRHGKDKPDEQAIDHQRISPPGPN